MSVSRTCHMSVWKLKSRTAEHSQVRRHGGSGLGQLVSYYRCLCLFPRQVKYFMSKQAESNRSYYSFRARYDDIYNSSMKARPPHTRKCHLSFKETYIELLQSTKTIWCKGLVIRYALLLQVFHATLLLLSWCPKRPLRILWMIMAYEDD